MHNSIDVSYVVAAHNSAQVIELTVDKIQEELTRRRLTFEVIVVENASVDATYDICLQIQEKNPNVRILQSAKGLGLAFRTGILAANGQLIVATADDLPFGFSDLESYFANTDNPEICIGSKGVPQSNVPRNFLRSVASIFFLTARFAILGLRIRDTQGTYLVRGDTARMIASQMMETGYIFTTEFSYVADQLKFTIRELPVTSSPEMRSTNVRIIRDGIDMCRGLIRIRRRHRLKRRAN
jgi:glycosyltransferase involved in cell wall biosynthesis